MERAVAPSAKPEGRALAHAGAARLVHGVDFSAAKDAGKRAWIATLEPAYWRGRAHAAPPRVARLARLEALPGSGRLREVAHAALARLVAGSPHALFALDFPFSVPRAVSPTGDWVSFALALGKRHASPSALAAFAWERCGGRESRRACDREAEAPLAPLNLRLRAQTFHGIRDVLALLVREGSACVLPMQPAEPGAPWVIEACPASFLKREGLYEPYKGRSRVAQRARRGIVRALARGGLAALPEPLARVAEEDPGGDALDAVLAAAAGARALAHGDDLTRRANGDTAFEGRIFF